MKNHLPSGFVSPFDTPFERGSSSNNLVTLNLDGVSSDLPVIRLDGREPGPCLLITAGIHGAEYPGIETLARLGKSLDTLSFIGRLVLLPISNTAAFRERSAFTTPPDLLNLNRSFPGEPDGSYTQQLAFVLLEHFLSRADAYIDLHSGDLVEALHPFSSYAVTGNESVDKRARQLAIAFGFQTVVRFDASDRGAMTHAAAANRGVPSLLAEIGGQGVWSDDDVDGFVEGIHRTMRYLEMMPDASDKEATRTIHQYERLDWYSSVSDGLWYPAVKVGESVSAGQSLGNVRSVFGEELQTIKASDSGLNIFMLSALSVRAGDPLVGVAANRTE